jgi:predicted secreted protein
MASKNVKILLEVNAGTEEIPVWEPVGGQRNATMSEEVEEIDVTSEDSDGAQEFEGGLYSATIDCDGLYIPTSQGYTSLKTAFRSKEKIRARIQEDGQPEKTRRLFYWRELNERCFV